MTRNRTTRRPARMASGLVGLLLFALLASGCSRTDRSFYAEGDAGTATLYNPFARMALWLGGCSPFTQQRWDGDRWVDEGGEIVCFWEGFAMPLEPRSERVDPFTARTAGSWRLSYDIGYQCQADAPLAEESCAWLFESVSEPFEVFDPNDDEAFCTATQGIWDPIACGHYHCGAPQVCAAVIPGCDCGPDANFVAAIGCVSDPVCSGVSGEQALCEQTGGIWDPLSCGHYSCGEFPDCDAIIPGCNCGPGAIFEPDLGCLAVPCGAPR